MTTTAATSKVVALVREQIPGAHAIPAALLGQVAVLLTSIETTEKDKRLVETERTRILNDLVNLYADASETVRNSVQPFTGEMRLIVNNLVPRAKHEWAKHLDDLERDLKMPPNPEEHRTVPCGGCGVQWVFVMTYGELRRGVSTGRTVPPGDRMYLCVGCGKRLDDEGRVIDFVSGEVKP